ncbi:hypothetical protein JG688_00006301 [Phytophthora aleatoria]|uniref:Uncharacterized protein n=1 Tax=Phytophthora aleatoria TaxID=2496075 RepID=A0A8J5ITW5_9STRA|nr:hypothetical protein JG688_00006301 [Phytophthora aleatoria]
MAFVAILQDVEQQLLRATQVVQLHVRLADTGPAELEEAEEKGIVGFIESLGIRVQRLVLYYRNACDVYFHELNGIVPFSKKEQLRAELMEIGAVLNSWIERVLAHKIQLQQLVNAAEFDMRITRLIDTLPGCAPASLVTNIRQAFGIPEPRALRPRQR